MRAISKENFFSVYYKRNGFLRTFYSQITRLQLVGRVLELHLLFSTVPFLFSLYLKSGGYKYFTFFIKTYTYEGVCVALKSRGFASSIVIRNVDGGVLYDRFILLFSPLLIKIKYVSPNVSGARLKKKFKAKLYFLKAKSQKKLIGQLFI